MGKVVRRGGGWSQGFANLNLVPGKSAKILAGVVIVATAAYALVPALRPYLVLTETTFTAGFPMALGTNLFVALPTSFFGLGILLAIAAYFFWDQVRMAWYSNRNGCIVAGVMAVVALVLLDTLLKGFGWGLTAAVLLLLWLATVVERQWGSNRTLLFTVIIILTVNVVGGILLWVWPSGLSAAVGADGAPVHGDGPLVDAFMAVWCLMAGRRPLAILNIEAQKLVWVLVAINVLDFLFVGRISGLMGLTAIGTTALLVSGLWRPRYLLDRVRFMVLERRVAARRGRMRVVKGDKKLH